MASTFDERLTRGGQSAPPDPSDGRGVLAGTLERRGEPICRRYGLSAPLCVLVHGVALFAILAASLVTSVSGLTPVPLRATVLQFAPPPPPPLRRAIGVFETATKPSARPTRAFVAPSFTSIPEDVLTPTFEPTLDMGAGADLGFDDGDPNGLLGGVPMGVVGGLPGGLPGGVFSGTGTELPLLPEADFGPRPIRMPKPSYTEAAIREKVTGSVVLRVIIDEQGKVEVLKVLRSIPELDEEAIRLVEARWRFEPATRNGRPVPVISELVVRFHLH